jgi:glucokinase
MTSVLAIDIGGSTIRGARATEDGLEEEPWAYTTETIDSAATLVDRLDDAYDGIDAVGVAAAAIVDRDTNELLDVTNWDGWDLTPLAETFSAPLAVENDADASALGLKWHRDLDPAVDLAYLTISTGIGAGILRNGDLVPSVEAGFVNINWDGDLEYAGVNDPWEGYAAGKQFPNRVREWLANDDRGTTLSGTEDAREFFEAVYAGDHVARDYYTELKRINAAGIGTLANLFSIDVVKVGGGVALNHPDLVDYDDDPYALAPVSLEDYCMLSPPTVELTSFGVDLELYGAAAAAFERLEA